MATDEASIETVELLRTHDPVRAGLVRGMLEAEGITVSTPGLHANGVLPHLRAAIEIIVRVPAPDLEDARRLVKEMEREVDEEPVAADNAPYREAAKKRPPALSPRLRRIAVVASFVFPGGAHFYVQRTAAGLGVIAGYAAVVLAMVASVPLSGYLLALVWLADVVGAFAHCDASRIGAPPDARRYAPAVGIGLVVAWSLLAPTALLPALAGHSSQAWCRYASRCSRVSESECLLDAVNYVPLELTPDCERCLDEGGTCREMEQRCETCWGEPVF